MQIEQHLLKNSIPEPMSGCWLWLGYCDRNGYGRMAINRRPKAAHRVSYAAHVGEIPEGLHVLHRCDPPACINPDHLFLGTNADNVADMVAKGRQARGAAVRGLPRRNSQKTHCPHGHEYTYENVYQDPRGFRQCRICRAARR